MNPIARIKKALRGNVPLCALPSEFARLARSRLRRAEERRRMDSIDAAPGRLGHEFAGLEPAALADHIRNRKTPSLWAPDAAEAQRRLFPDETARLLAAADAIVRDNTWEVGGFGPIKFDRPNYWRCDPLTRCDWGLDHHSDTPIYTAGGPDIRVLWELNRFGHVVELGRAFAVTGDERYAETFFRHLEEWTAQNPYARGANWASPMDVIMRAVNIVAAFEFVKHADRCTPERVALVLKLTDTHCRFTFDNIEFSYIARGNHYLTNLAGLFFAATLLPELEHSRQWQRFGLAELLLESEHQILADGADWESSTGYHKFVAEMLLVCLHLAHKNGVGIGEADRMRCRKMLDYLRCAIRPDRRMPLVGDCDGSQFLPIVRRDADDAKYLLDIAAALCNDPELKEDDECSPEVLWLIGTEGVERFDSLGRSEHASISFPHAGSQVLRHEDLYLLLNTSDVGLGGRGSHSHNDALSIEVSALGRPWIIDPGSHVYNYDREGRHRFRSTAAHSTLRIDGREQNRIDASQPFVSANDARPIVLDWSTSGEIDAVSAEHYGYSPLVHRRTVELDKRSRYWTIVDEISGEGDHDLTFSFQAAPGVTAALREGGISLTDEAARSLYILSAIAFDGAVEEAGFAPHYGGFTAATMVRLSSRVSLPFVARWLIVPVPREEDAETRLASLHHLLQNNS